jgi:hypothetical protein
MQGAMKAVVWSLALRIEEHELEPQNRLAIVMGKEETSCNYQASQGFRSRT